MGQQLLETRLVAMDKGTFMLPQLEAEWIQTIAQIQSARFTEHARFFHYESDFDPRVTYPEKTTPTTIITGKELRELSFLGGNGVIYTFEDGEFIFYLTDSKYHPLLRKNINRYYLVEDPTALVLPDDVSKSLNLKQLVSDGTATRFLASSLPIKPDPKMPDKYAYIEISKRTLAEGRKSLGREYGEETARLIDRLHGSAAYGHDGLFGLTINNSGLPVTEITLLNQQYAMAMLNGKGTDAKLASFSGVSETFNACYVSLTGRRHGYFLVSMKPEVELLLKQTGQENSRIHWEYLSRTIR